jgi:hypothetical protein
MGVCKTYTAGYDDTNKASNAGLRKDRRMISFEKKTILITGASSGIGKAFAETLSGRGANVILVARSRDKLMSLASEIKKQSKVKAEVIVADLSDPKAPARVHAAVTKKGYQIDVLINNAGFGTQGQFHTLPAEVEQKEVMLNAAAVVQLTHLFLPGMVKKKNGIIINIASAAAFEPLAFMAVYGATKAFVLSFSEALWAEYRKRGIHILVVCPGPIETNFSKVVGTEARNFGKRRTSQSVVETTLRALERGKSYTVDNRLMYFAVQSIRLLPRGFVAKLTARIMKPKGTISKKSSC